MPYSTFHELAAPSAPSSRYRTIYPQLSARYQPALSMQGRDIFGYRIHTVLFPDATTHGVPFHIASALASWNIPPKSWIHYYNGTYAWPVGLAIPDSRVSQLEQSVAPMTAPLSQFSSIMATGPWHSPNNHSSCVSNGIQQIRRAAISHSSLRDQYDISSPAEPIDSQDTCLPGLDGSSKDSNSHASLESSEEDLCPSPGFDDPMSLEEKLTDLRAIVHYIVPAGGLDPNANYGPVFERLKCTPSDVDEGVEHFVRDAEALDPDFKNKLTEFSNDGPGVFQGASPTDDWRRKEMYMWEYIQYQGEWTKLSDIGKRTRELNAGQQQQEPQTVYTNHIQPHPAQLEDEMEYQTQYRHAEADDDYTDDFDGDFDDDFSVVGTSKSWASSKLSPKWQKGTGTIRRRSSSSSKDKRETKQQKMDRGSKEDEQRRSCFDLSW
ncbi:hypothetical protein BKA64DRAFT_702986 [Cadophora sp. MPI-SDFR-AT-0126]|nr:hypothetical protein BKA64DRAFT_702986 [Leotiomycetes sp. MPI-SDFR-AT-0126]